MPITIVKLGSPRTKSEGLRIGTVRRPPRGVRKEEYAARDIYDVWFPNLAPSEQLLKETDVNDEAGWRKFKRKYLAEMKEPGARRDIELLAALSQQTNFSVGCYCEDESRCHRSLLRALLEKAARRCDNDLSQRNSPALLSQHWLIDNLSANLSLSFVFLRFGAANA